MRHFIFVIAALLAMLGPVSALGQPLASDVYVSLRTAQGDRWLGFGADGAITLGSPTQAAVFVMVPQTGGDRYFKIRGTQGDPWLIPMNGVVRSGNYQSSPGSIHFVKNVAANGLSVSVGDQVSIRGTVGDPWWVAKANSNLLRSGVTQKEATVFVIEKSLEPVVRLAKNIAGPNYTADYSLNKETQVALACTSKFGATKAAMACMAGTLTVNELDKCRTKGIGGEGCFGRNNTLVKAFNDHWDSVKNEGNPVTVLTRLGTGVSVTDIQKYGLAGVVILSQGRYLAWVASAESCCQKGTAREWRLS